jgi:hypothetical protein
MPLTPSFAKLRVKAERCSLSEARKGVDRLQSAKSGSLSRLSGFLTQRRIGVQPVGYIPTKSMSQMRL